MFVGTCVGQTARVGASRQRTNSSSRWALRNHTTAPPIQISKSHRALGVNDTPVFLLNEYIVELNPANFNILNQILNWIFLKFLKLNNFLNLISLNWIMFWIEFCPKFSYWIFYWIEFCPKISYWIFYWTESGWKTENQLYFESILWYYTLKIHQNALKCPKIPQNTLKYVIFMIYHD